MISLIFILICSHSSEIVHVRTQRCDRNTQIWWRRRDVAITSQCAEASFSLAGEDEVECIEVVETFKYLGRMLDRLDNYWPAVRRNVRKARRPLRTLQPKFCWGFPPGCRISNLFLGPLPLAPPCAVAPDQWGKASMGEYCTVGVGEGDAFWNHRCVGQLLS